MDINCPAWAPIGDDAARAARSSSLGDSGIDVVMNDRKGSTISEIDACSGLDIQAASGTGRRKRMQDVFRYHHIGESS